MWLKTLVNVRYGIEKKNGSASASVELNSVSFSARGISELN